MLHGGEDVCSGIMQSLADSKYSMLCDRTFLSPICLVESASTDVRWTCFFISLALAIEYSTYNVPKIWIYFHHHWNTVSLDPCHKSVVTSNVIQCCKIMSHETFSSFLQKHFLLLAVFLLNMSQVFLLYRKHGDKKKVDRNLHMWLQMR